MSRHTRRFAYLALGASLAALTIAGLWLSTASYKFAQAPMVERATSAAPIPGMTAMREQQRTPMMDADGLIMAAWGPAPSRPRYARVEPHRFHRSTVDALSTFGADVDTASYTNVRRMLSQGELPPSAAVRAEEFINYFRFPYIAPSDGRAVSLTTEISDCPWAPGHKLVLIGARADATADRQIAGRNLVLLIDVSGSMSSDDRLPLLKNALALFIDSLAPEDKVSIVTYAGTSGVALPTTPARHRDVIQRALAELESGGSTNGAAGIETAYRMARQAFVRGGVNRVILATDGDFNVGVTGDDELLKIIEREKASGIFLSVLGVGTDNLNDSMMELVADRGNGHYSYLDSMQEARRVLLREASSTLEVVARDVKFQVEFNPAVVAAWRQIGYENRALAAEDFNDDRKDAGEMGAGHTVTALYEIVPVGVALPDGDPAAAASIDPLKYQRTSPATPAARAASDEWLTVKARYQRPEGGVSMLVNDVLRPGGSATWLPLASSVAEFALLLREHSNDATRWTGLERRISRLVVPPSLASEVRELAELVATSRGLARLVSGEGEGAKPPIR